MLACQGETLITRKRQQRACRGNGAAGGANVRSFGSPDDGPNRGCCRKNPASGREISIANDRSRGRTRRREVAWGDLKAFKLKSGRDRAANEGPGPKRFGRLPHACIDHRLRSLAGQQIGSKPHAVDAAISGQPEHERRTGVVVPDLRRVEVMPVRALARAEQEIDRGRNATFGLARPQGSCRIAEGLAIMSPLRMRLEVEQADDLAGSQRGHHGDGSELIFLGADHREDLRAGTGWCFFPSQWSSESSAVPRRPAPAPLRRARAAPRYWVRWSARNAHWRPCIRGRN